MTEPRASFIAPGDAPLNGARRLLLISYHFPPSNTAGALRWRKLAPLAAERGWTLDVVAADPGAIGVTTKDGLADLPSGTRVFFVAPPVLRRDRFITAALNMIRGARSATSPSPAAAVASAPVAQPAPSESKRPGLLSRTYGAMCDNAIHTGWAAAAADIGSRLSAVHRYEAVISCGPPHMAHVAARRIAARRDLALVIDLRDPWRLVERLADSIDSPIWRWHAEWHEREVLPHADLIVMNTEPARDAMRKLYPDAASRIIAVMNGFDEEKTPASQRPRRFTVTYTGSIYLDRDPRPLFEAARRVIARRELTPDEFGITLVGSVQAGRGGSTVGIAKELGIEAFVEVLPHRPRSDLFRILASSAVLLSLPQDSHMAIPSKLYEYMQFDAWILALAEPHSAPARLLAGSDADVLSPSDADGIAAALEARYDQYRHGDYPVRLAADRRFSRRAQAEILFDALERCIGEPLVAV